MNYSAKKDMYEKVLDASNDLFAGTRKDPKGTVKSTHTEELIITLCGPIGSPLESVKNKIKSAIEDEYGYECTIIKISELIEEHCKSLINKEVRKTTEHERIVDSIQYGDELRQKFGNAFFAELAISKITFDRIGRKKSGKNNRVCYIIDSIKNKEELRLLELVYGEILFSIGVFSSIADRIQSLKVKDIDEKSIHALIDTDSGEEVSYGQQVADIFPLSDFFIRIDENTETQTKRKINRFLELIFGAELITPTSSESAMNAASMAAKNSACLSRQVGAAITNSQGEIIALGWNDVPKFGGGLYRAAEESDKDKRCWNYKGSMCHNDKEKMVVSDALAKELLDSDIIKPDQLSDVKSKLRKNGRLKNLIEFSRAVHAEMHAIISAGAANKGNLIGARLFCTTYPCHSCARHIVATGISEIHYIEPYRKSLAIRLHDDSLTENEKDEDKVRLIAFDGVSPNRFSELFAYPSTGRKTDGKMQVIHKKTAKPRYEKSLVALNVLESIVTKSLIDGGIIKPDVQENENDTTYPA